MKTISTQDEDVQTIDPNRKHLIFPANQPDFKPRKLIIPPVGSAVSSDSTDDGDDTLAS